MKWDVFSVAVIRPDDPVSLAFWADFGQRDENLEAVAGADHASTGAKGSEGAARA